VDVPAFHPLDLKRVPNWIEVNHRDADGQPMAAQAYKVFFESGAVIEGQLSAQGHARHDDVPEKAQRVEYALRQAKQAASSDPLAQLLGTVNQKLN
jgi:type VI secretion system secreted protein VgrG